MAKPRDVWEADAREAAERIDAARELGEQLALPLPDEVEDGDGDLGGDLGGEDRRGRGAGRVNSQLRRWLAQRGLRQPEEVLAAAAGLDRGGDPVLASMADAEAVLAWAEQGSADTSRAPRKPTTAMRLEVFRFVHTARLRAAEALLPYGLAKAGEAPAAPPPVVLQLNTGAPLRDVTPQAPARPSVPGGSGRAIAPPPMPSEIEEKQGVAEVARRPGSDDAGPDGASG